MNFIGILNRQGLATEANHRCCFGVWKRYNRSKNIKNKKPQLSGFLLDGGAK
jgi:hypothetical protein